MGFSNPIWLWGLTGLLIPIGIHLLSLKEGKTIYIGSIRHLRESNTAQFSSIRLNEIVLLLIRCLLIILLVLLLSGFRLNVKSAPAGKWLVIDKGIERENTVITLLDSLRKEGYEVHFLANGFPLLKDSAEVLAKKNYWSLVSDMNNIDAKDIIVLSYNFSKNFRGERISKPEKIKWITIPTSETNFLAKSIQLNSDSAWIRNASSTAEQTVLSSQISQADKGLEARKNILVTIYADDSFSYDAKIVLASLKAIEKSAPYTILTFLKDVTEFSQDSSDWVIWFSKRKIETENSNVIAYATCKASNLNLLEESEVAELYCDSVQARGWVITEKLNEGNALQENFTTDLADILIRGELYNENDTRAEPEQRLWSSLGGAQATTNEKGSSPVGMLSILLLLTLISERLLAIRKNQ